MGLGIMVFVLIGFRSMCFVLMNFGNMRFLGHRLVHEIWAH